MKLPTLGWKLVLVSAVTLVAQRTLSNQDAPRSSEITAAIKENEEGDLASALNEAVDGAEVYLSPKAYRAIQAVEAYRRGVQSKDLTAQERLFDNFNISIRSSSRSDWLRADEKKSCFVIVLAPRLLPGERVKTDTPAKVGRGAIYAVRRSDYQVVRTELGKRSGGG